MSLTSTSRGLAATRQPSALSRLIAVPIDEFAGDNAGLVVAELELPTVDAAFERPSWVAREVTEELRYYNLALAERPYSRWNAQEQS